MRHRQRQRTVQLAEVYRVPISNRSAARARGAATALLSPMGEPLRRQAAHRPARRSRKAPSTSTTNFLDSPSRPRSRTRIPRRS